MVRWQLSGCVLSCAIVDAMREMAFRLSSDKIIIIMRETYTNRDGERAIAQQRERDMG